MGLPFKLLARFWTSPLPDPVFSNIQVQVVGTTVTVTWDTAEVGTSGVEFGATASYGNAVINDAEGSTLSHTVVLDATDGMVAGHLYHCRVASFIDGDWRFSADLTFQVAGSSLPAISAVVATPAATSIAFTWTTDIGSDSFVLWGTTPELGNVDSSLDTNVTSHGVTIGSADGLMTGRLCHFMLGSAADGINYTYSTPASVFLPLVITDIAQGIVTTTATITWVTDNGSDSTVEWGLTTDYGNTSTSLDDDVTAHTVVLDYDDGIRENNTYHFRVRSSIDGGVTYSYSSDQTLVVPDVPAAGLLIEDSSGLLLQEDSFLLLLDSGLTPLKISELNDATVVAGADITPGVQAGATVAISIDQLKTFVRS